MNKLTFAAILNVFSLGVNLPLLVVAMLQGVLVLQIAHGIAIVISAVYLIGVFFHQYKSVEIEDV